MGRATQNQKPKQTGYNIEDCRRFKNIISIRGKRAIEVAPG